MARNPPTSPARSPSSRRPTVRRSGSSPTPRSASSRCATSPPSSVSSAPARISGTARTGRRTTSTARTSRGRKAKKARKARTGKTKDKETRRRQRTQGEARDQGAQGREARDRRRLRAGFAARSAHRSGDPRDLRHVGQSRPARRPDRGAEKGQGPSPDRRRSWFQPAPPVRPIPAGREVLRDAQNSPLR